MVQERLHIRDVAIQGKNLISRAEDALNFIIVLPCEYVLAIHIYTLYVFNLILFGIRLYNSSYWNFYLLSELNNSI